MPDLYDRLEDLQGRARLLIDDAKQLRESLSDALDPELEWTRTGPTDGSTPGPSLPLLKQLSSSTSDFFLNWRMRRSEEHTSELQSLRHLVCRLLLEKKTHYTTATCARFAAPGCALRALPRTPP